MLTKLTIENIALVPAAELSLSPGLTVLTGETGAGKSIIVTALGLALGGPADKEHLRHGAESAEVTAHFDVSRMPAGFVHDFAEYIVEDSIELKRRVAKNGSSRAWVNDRRIGLERLKPLTASLAEILSQHAHQSLLNEDNHLTFLDSYAGLSGKVELLGQRFAAWQKSADELRRVRAAREQLIERRELLTFQKEEIEKASLKVGEEEELLAERKILDSARNLMTSSAAIGEILDGESASVKDMLAAARHELDSMVQVDASLADQAGELYDIQVRIEELRRAIEQYGASIHDDPGRIEEINTRLDEIYHLKKKYGGSEEAVLGTYEMIRQQLAQSPDTDDLIVQLEKQTERHRSEYSDLAVAVSRARRTAAVKLQKQVAKELADLAIDTARFEIAFNEQEDPDGILCDARCLKPSENGLEQARFDFAANPGEPLRPLVKTASGGEISRVLLALKSAQQLQAGSDGAFIVFDEVDAGIGGKTATEVGRKLKKLAHDRQLIVVTHLHQIARQADHHFVVEKSRSDKRNVVTVRRLDKDSVAKELKRMVALPADE